MGLVSRVLALGLSCLGATACTSTSGFQCAQDSQCGADGVCTPDGWCGFLDDACPSGFRYGEHAGGGLGGVCVPEGEGTSGPPATATGATDPAPGSETGGASSTLALTGSIDDDTTGAPTPTTTGTPLDGSGSSGGSDTGEPIDPALVAWYTFDDPTDLYADASGNERHAWCGGDECPQYEAGVVGGAIVLDGIDDHLHVDHDRGLALVDDFSIALWVQVDAVTIGEFRTITAKPFGPATGNSWEIGLPGSMALYAGAGGAAGFSSVQTPLDATGVWHHLAFTWGDGEALLYLDGAEVDSAPSVAIEYDGHAMMIGADIDNRVDDNFLTGKIDELRVYARVLDSTEVADLASDGS